jgi:SAM-dependent methyltransferase
MAAPLRPSVSLRYDAVVRALRSFHTEPRTVLEIGCGQGGLASKLARHAAYVGLEPDPSSYSVARDRLRALPRADLRNERFEDLEGGRSFDLVCAFEVLEHLPDDQAALERWSTRVAPGGLLMVTVPGYQDHFSEYDEYVGHYRRYEPAQLEELFRSVGLDDVKVMHYGFPLNSIVEEAHKLIVRRRRAHESSEQTMEDKTAASGRVLTIPDPVVAMATFAASPFRLIQRLFPHRGLGLLAVGRVATDAQSE